MVDNFTKCRSFLRGSIVALITPMNVKGQVDTASLKKIVDYHVDNGTNAIASAGTTGELATLNNKEHLDTILRTLEYADNRIPVIATSSSSSTKQAIVIIKSLEKTNVIASLISTPHYIKPSQEGLYQHFRAIAEQTNLPQILYNIPSRTGCDLLPETISRLATLDNFIAVKEATGDLRRINRIRKLIKNKNFILLSGDDITALEFIQLGGHGVISVTANIAAKLMSEICKLALANNYTKAHKLNDRLIELHNQLFIEPNPVPIKWACCQLGLIESDTVRSPLIPLTLKGQVAVKKALKIAGL